MDSKQKIFKAGNFASYGELIHLEGKYIVKQRQDLLSLLPANQKYQSIIEFGCADGTNLFYFAEKLNIQPNNIFGVDICLSNETNYKKFNFIHQSAEEFLANNKHCFDLILLSDVLEHIYNPWKILDQLKSRLNPNGCILISVPNLQNLNYLFAVNSGEFNYSASGLFDETHIRFFSLNTMRNYLKELGFNILSTSFRPDHSLSHIRQIAQTEFQKGDSFIIDLNNLSVQINKNNLDLYTGQQILICATYGQ